VIKKHWQGKLQTGTLPLPWVTVWTSHWKEKDWRTFKQLQDTL